MNICENIENTKRKAIANSNRSGKTIFSKQTDRFEMDKNKQNQGGQGCQGLPNTKGRNRQTNTGYEKGR